MNYSESLQKLREIEALPSGWDSYGAKEPDIYCVARARALLFHWQHIDVYEISPLASGGIRIAWFGPPSMEIDIEPKDEP